MRKTTKKLAITMAAVLAIGSVSFTGCGSNDNGGSSSKEATSGSSEVSSEDAVQNLINSTKDTVKLTVWASHIGCKV